MTKRARIGASIVAIIAVGGLVALVGMLRYGFSARDEPTALEAFIARRLRHLAVPSAARDMENPLPLTEKILSEARAHFADHCALCHGNDGRGLTQIGRNLYPKAPDMSSSRTQSLSDGELYYIINNGVRLTGMPAWGGDNPEHDRESWKLVHFIRHLPEITPEEIEEMKGMNPRTRAEFEAEEGFRRSHQGGTGPSPSPKHGH